MNALLVMAALTQVPDSDFARKVVADCPALRIVSTDIDRVRLLREWAWAHTDGCSGSLGALNEAEWWNTASASELFATQERKEGGVLCAGAGIALQRLYEEFGYKSWTVGHESIGGFSHALTLVEIQHEGRTLISLQDSTWNIDFTVNNQPVDYFDMLTILKERRHDVIGVNEPEWKLCPKFPSVVVRPEHQAGLTFASLVKGSNFVNINHHSVEVLPNGTMVITSPRTFTNWIQKKQLLPDGAVRSGSNLERMVQEGYPPSPLYWYSRPYWISGPNQSSVLSAGRQAAGI